jgi:hypothetical protein
MTIIEVQPKKKKEQTGRRPDESGLSDGLETARRK